MKADTALPLKGARKKPEHKPRNEGVVKLNGRRCWYARLYPAGSKRATYRSTGRIDIRGAEELIPSLRGALNRRAARATTPPPSNQPCFDLSV